MDDNDSKSYVIACKPTVNELEELVGSLMGRGYQPIGGVFSVVVSKTLLPSGAIIENWNFYQAMIKSY